MKEGKGVLSGTDGIPELALSPCVAPHPTRGRITSMVKAPEALTDVGDFAKDTEVFTPSLTHSEKGRGKSERAQTPSKPLNN